MYYYEKDGTHEGPVELNELKKLIQSKQVSQDTLVWSAGMDRWEVAGRLDALKHDFAAVPPPLPSTSETSISEPAEPATISPSIEPRSTGKTTPKTAPFDTTNPWVRLYAKLIDIMLLGVVPMIAGFVLLSVVDPRIVFANSPGFELLSSIGIIALMGLNSAICLGLFSNTPGKALYGIRIVHAGGEPPAFTAFLKREFGVFVQGFGLGIPIVSFVTMYIQYRRLANLRPASYDEGAFFVGQRPIGVPQKVSAGIASFACVAATLVAVVATNVENAALSRMVIWTNPLTSKTAEIRDIWTFEDAESEADRAVIATSRRLGLEVVFGQEAWVRKGDPAGYGDALFAVLSSSESQLRRTSPWRVRQDGQNRIAEAEASSSRFRHANIRVTIIADGNKYWRTILFEHGDSEIAHDAAKEFLQQLASTF